MIFGLVLTLLTGGLLALHHEERQLTFRAVREAASWYSGLPGGVEEINLPVSNAQGAPHIHAWWWPAPDPAAPVVLYLHGARWNLTGQVYRLRQLRDFGFSVFAIDYRGFGTSDGDLPSEATVYEDARVAWDWLVRHQPDPAKRFIYGHSLGGAVAVDLAASLSATLPPVAAAVAASARSGLTGAVASRAVSRASNDPLKPLAAGGLIIESSFTTLADVAAALSSRWLPLGLLLSQKFDSVTKIAKVSMPVLVVHGENDRYVPSRFSEALFAAVHGPKKLLLVEGASHNNSMFAGESEYRDALRELFGLGDRSRLRSSTPLHRRPGESPAVSG